MVSLPTLTDIYILGALLACAIAAAVSVGVILIRREAKRAATAARNAAMAAISAEFSQLRRDQRRTATQVATHDEGMVALRRQMEEQREAIADLRAFVLHDVVEGMLGATLPRGPAAEWEGPPSGVARRVVSVTRDDEGEG